MSKIISQFVNHDVNNKELIDIYRKIYRETEIINVPNFISETVLTDIRKDIEEYPWWKYTFIPNQNVWKVSFIDELTEENRIECQNQLENRNFCYHFRRSFDNHYESCYCVACKLKATIRNYSVTDMICKIVGCKKIESGEIFLSKYGKDDFLSLHHDIKKGNISVTFSLTYDWHPTYGGILHFCDNDNNIYKSISPKLGSLTIFKIDQEHGINHFVSSVNVNKNRYTLTTWYSIIE